MRSDDAVRPATDLAIRLEDTLLLVIDVQEKLAPVMHGRLSCDLRSNLRRLGRAAEILGLPAVLTEQHPKGLGPTLGEVREVFKDAKVFPKMSFDAAKDPSIDEALRSSGKGTIVVAGMESHICVYQTVRSLAKMYRVHVLRDAVAARATENYEVGLNLSGAAGGVVTSTETVLFDLLGSAGTATFRAISKLVK